MVSRRVQFGLAQLGRKPGARALKKATLNAHELPGGHFRRMDQRTYRTAYASEDETWGKNARAVNSVSVWRSFVARRAGKYLQLNVVPLASVDDIPEAMTVARAGGLRNFRSRAKIVETVDLELPSAISGAANVQVVEQTTTGVTGEGTIRTLYFTVGRYLVTIMATSVNAPWSWDSLVELAGRQASRLPAEQRAPGSTPT